MRKIKEMSERMNKTNEQMKKRRMMKMNEKM